jgi:hypothetical protein
VSKKNFVVVRTGISFILITSSLGGRKKQPSDTRNSKQKVGSEQRLNSGQKTMTFKLLDNGT